jgi:hypothetical protein
LNHRSCEPMTRLPSNVKILSKTIRPNHSHLSVHASLVGAPGQGLSARSNMSFSGCAELAVCPACAVPDGCVPTPALRAAPPLHVSQERLRRWP